MPSKEYPEGQDPFWDYGSRAGRNVSDPGSPEPEEPPPVWPDPTDVPHKTYSHKDIEKASGGYLTPQLLDEMDAMERMLEAPEDTKRRGIIIRDEERDLLKGLQIRRNRAIETIKANR